MEGEKSLPGERRKNWEITVLFIINIPIVDGRIACVLRAMYVVYVYVRITGLRNSNLVSLKEVRPENEQ